MKFVLLLLMIVVSSGPGHAAEPSLEDRRNEAIQMIVRGEVDDALRLLESLGNSGDIDSQVVRGAVLVQLKRVPEAVSVLEPLANAGNSEAQWYLYGAYMAASPQQPKTAEGWLRKAAAAGNKKAIALLRNLPTAPKPVNGRLATAELLAVIERIVTEKIAGLSEKAVACYGVPKVELITSTRRHLSSCLAEQPSEYQQSVAVSETDVFIRNLAQCANAAAFQRAGKSVSEMATCLGSP